jgi:hypothetical protein
MKKGSKSANGGKVVKVRTYIAFITFITLTTVTTFLQAARVEIRGGQFYVDGEPFYVVAVGYNGTRPHQNPGTSYAETNRRLTTMDFRRIKAAHFNTIRTWDALEPSELELARNFGLMVLQGIWIDPHQDFSDPHNQDASIDIVKSVAEKSKDYDNILGYLVMTEPSHQAVIDSGEEQTSFYFRKLKRAIQEIDPRPVSMDSWLPVTFLDHSVWDFVTFNTFAFAPASLNYALGFPGYNKWLVDRFAADKPFVVGETGGYAVSKSSTSKFGGAGGLNEYDQSLKDLDSLRGTVEGHTSGAALVSWIDAWHYPKMSDKHEDEPWAWDGIMGIPTDSKKDVEGIPRLIYRDVTVYNEVIPNEPKANHIYQVGEDIPIKAYAAENVAGVEYNLNGSDWTPLKGSGHGNWLGFFQLPKTARHRQRFSIRALDDIGQELAKKTISFVAATHVDKSKLRKTLSQKKVEGWPAEHISIGLLEISKKNGALSCRVHLTDDEQNPIVKRKVYFGYFFPSGWREAQGAVTTDEHGEVTLTCPLRPNNDDHYLFVAAGSDSPDQIRTSDMRLFKLGS